MKSNWFDCALKSTFWVHSRTSRHGRCVVLFIYSCEGDSLTRYKADSCGIHKKIEKLLCIYERIKLRAKAEKVISMNQNLDWWMRVGYHNHWAKVPGSQNIDLIETWPMWNWTPTQVGENTRVQSGENYLHTKGKWQLGNGTWAHGWKRIPKVLDHLLSSSLECRDRLMVGYPPLIPLQLCLRFDRCQPPFPCVQVVSCGQPHRLVKIKQQAHPCQPTDSY